MSVLSCEIHIVWQSLTMKKQRFMLLPLWVLERKFDIMNYNNESAQRWKIRYPALLLIYIYIFFIIIQEFRSLKGGILRLGQKVPYECYFALQWCEGTSIFRASTWRWVKLCHTVKKCDCPKSVRWTALMTADQPSPPRNVSEHQAGNIPAKQTHLPSHN